MKLWVLTLVDTILLQRTTRKVTNDLTTDRLTFQTFPTFYFHFVTNSQISWIRNKFRKFRKHSDFKSSLSRISQTSSFGNKEIWQMMIQCTNQCQGEVPWFFFDTINVGSVESYFYFLDKMFFFWKLVWFCLPSSSMFEFRFTETCHEVLFSPPLYNIENYFSISLCLPGVHMSVPCHRSNHGWS